MRRPLDLPLQPLACPSSPHHQPPMRSLPQPEERVTENRLADPFLQEKPSSHCLDVSPQRPTVDRPPPATDPPPKTHVGNSGSRRGQTWRPCVLWAFLGNECIREQKQGASFPALHSGTPPVTETASSEPLLLSLQRRVAVWERVFLGMSEVPTLTGPQDKSCTRPSLLELPDRKSVV